MRKVLAIVGPTASGKTKLSIEIAKRLNGEIISADSRQVYKHIPVSTSQPDLQDLKTIKHYFINELNLTEEFNAGEFGTKGREIIEDIFSRKKLPIVVGGSGLYIRSVLDGFFEEEIESKEIREMLYERLNSEGEEFLYEELKRVDEETFKIIPPRKIRRVIRALEVYHATGKKISDMQKEKPQINFQTVQFGLMFERKLLYKRIDERVDEMIRKGLIDEVRLLQQNNYDYRKNYSVDTVGIKEVFKYFEGEYEFDEMISMIKQNSRRYAKRQMTWFRKDKRINWIDVNEDTREESLVNELLERFWILDC